MSVINSIAAWYSRTPTSEICWIAFGFLGQLIFTGRMVLQWIASERRGESYVPLSFWYCSLIGGWILLVYAIYRRDPVIICGQMLGVVVYGRNLVFIHRKLRADAQQPTPQQPDLQVIPMPDRPTPAIPTRRAG